MFDRFVFEKMKKYGGLLYAKLTDFDDKKLSICTIKLYFCNIQNLLTSFISLVWVLTSLSNNPSLCTSLFWKKTRFSVKMFLQICACAISFLGVQNFTSVYSVLTFESTVNIAKHFKRFSLLTFIILLLIKLAVEMFAMCAENLRIQHPLNDSLFYTYVCILCTIFFFRENTAICYNLRQI